MAVNPGVQERAQREIDRIVGVDRLPDFSDRATMPYIEAIYREVLRCRPPLQIGIPHCVTEDDHYKGFFIPKSRSSLCPTSLIITYESPTIDATVLGNIWRVFRNSLFHEH